MLPLPGPAIRRLLALSGVHHTRYVSVGRCRCKYRYRYVPCTVWHLVKEVPSQTVRPSWGAKPLHAARETKGGERERAKLKGKLREKERKEGKACSAGETLWQEQPRCVKINHGGEGGKHLKAFHASHPTCRPHDAKPSQPWPPTLQSAPEFSRRHC